MSDVKERRRVPAGVQRHRTFRVQWDAKSGKLVIEEKIVQGGEFEPEFPPPIPEEGCSRSLWLLEMTRFGADLVDVDSKGELARRAEEEWQRWWSQVMRGKRPPTSLREAYRRARQLTTLIERCASVICPHTPTVYIGLNEDLREWGEGFTWFGEYSHGGMYDRFTDAAYLSLYSSFWLLAGLSDYRLRTDSDFSKAVSILTHEIMHGSLWRFLPNEVNRYQHIGQDVAFTCRWDEAIAKQGIDKDKLDENVGRLGAAGELLQEGIAELGEFLITKFLEQWVGISAHNPLRDPHNLDYAVVVCGTLGVIAAAEGKENEAADVILNAMCQPAACFLPYLLHGLAQLYGCSKEVLVTALADRSTMGKFISCVRTIIGVADEIAEETAKRTGEERLLQQEEFVDIFRRKVRVAIEAGMLLVDFVKALSAIPAAEATPQRCREILGRQKRISERKFSRMEIDPVAHMERAMGILYNRFLERLVDRPGGERHA